jgi:hypothetical protein
LFRLSPSSCSTQAGNLVRRSRKARIRTTPVAFPISRQDSKRIFSGDKIPDTYCSKSCMLAWPSIDSGPIHSEVLDDSALVHTHLHECKECQLKLAEIAMDGQWKGPERRSEPRVAVNFPGRLKLLDPMTSVGPPHDVLVIEISRSGFKVRTPRYLISKTLVQVHFSGKAMLGEVRWCTRTDSGYDAGIKQVPSFPS